MRIFLYLLLVLGTATAAAKKKSEPIPPENLDTIFQSLETSEETEEDDIETTLDKIEPLSSKNKVKNEPGEPKVLEACTENPHQLCQCEVETMDCQNIDFGEKEFSLQTANLKIKKKDFIPYIVDLSDNDIEKLTTGAIIPGSESSISELKLSLNSISHIDGKAFQKFTNLTKLYLDNNHIKTLNPKWFEPLGKTLHKLDLSNNRLRDIPDGVFSSLKNLKSLSIDFNNFKKLRKEMFKGLDNLENLSIDGCLISDLPGDIFEYMPKLKGVSLRSNKLTEMPRALSNIKTLQSLDISENALAEIHDNAFGSLQNLEEIYMDEMPYLTVIRDCAFCGLVKLQKLSAHNNTKLVELHPNAFGFIESQPGKKATNVEELDILGCNLTTLSEHMLDYSALSEFKYSSNPWNCTCEMEFLVGDQQSGGSYDHYFAQCAYPEKLAKKTLASLQPYQVCEATRQAHKVSRVIIIFVLFLIVIFVSMGCFLMITTGKLSDMLRKVQNIPEVSYSNLTNRCEENIVLEEDFEARPAQV